MKRSLIGVAALVVLASSAFAAEPWKVLRTAAGPVWTNQQGMTLYTFDRDPMGGSSCYGRCAFVWPPFKASGVAKATGDWTIVTRKDGSHMWAYDGRALYTFRRDKQPGQVTGNGVYQFGALWHVAGPAAAVGSYKPKK